MRGRDSAGRFTGGAGGGFNASVTLGADVDRFMRGMDSAADRMQSAGASFAGSAAKMVAAAAALAGGMVMHSLIKGGMEFNAQLEAGRDQIAATLRLYDHVSPGVEASASAAAQFTANLREAEAVQKRLVTIADESPGSFQQVDRMFKSMLPSARAITGDMEKIMALTQKTTLFAGITGDFDLAGSQMGMILGGGAGQEMQMWRLLKPKLKELMVAGDKASEGDSSTKITTAFNQALTPAERLEYVMKSLDSLGPEVAEHFGRSWEGATSQVQSRLRELSGRTMKPLYEMTKDWLVTATSGDDFLSTTGSGFGELKEIADYMGAKIGEAGRKFFNGFSDVISWSIENWEYIASSLERGFNTGLAAAKMFVAAKLAGGAAGAIFNMGKAVVDTGKKIPGFVEHIKKLHASTAPQRDELMPRSIANWIEDIGRSSAMALPAMGLLALAVAGIAVVFVGIAASIIENWDQIVNDLASGTATLAPVFDVIDLLWVKLVAVGNVFLGTNSVVTTTQSVVEGVASAFNTMMGFLSSTIRVTAYFSMALGGLYNTLQMIAIMFNLVITGILTGVKFLLDSVNEWIGSEALASASTQTGYALAKLETDRNKRVDSLDMSTTRKLFDAADAFDRAAVEGEGITANLRKEFEERLAKLGKGDGGGLTKAKGAKVDIHNLNMYNDFRDQDPDRVMGTFVQKLEDVTMRPTQSVALDDNGV